MFSFLQYLPNVSQKGKPGECKFKMCFIKQGISRSLLTQVIIFCL